MAPTTRSSHTDRVERAFSAVLKPISKILINNNFTLQLAIESLKRALVRAALDQPEATDSLVSLKTGLHRKDVKRIRADLEAGSPKKYPIRGLAIVLATWTQDAAFSDGTGNARILPRKRVGKTPGFDELVKASKVDLAPATVLVEMEAQNLVAHHADGGIELLSATFVGQTGEASLEAFEATVTDHIRIAAENVLSPAGAPRQFDQVLRYSHLSAKSVAELEADARRMAQDYLEALNAKAHRLQSEDDASGSLANGRFVTGVFVAPTSPGDGPKASGDEKSREQKPR